MEGIYMVTEKNQTIAILGLSDNPTRYAHMAYQKLLHFGYKNLIGISPKNLDLANIRCRKTIDEIDVSVHTLTIYVGEDKSSKLINQILKLAPSRIIFNPGSENAQLEALAIAQGIEVIHGCTLVMLSTDQF